MKKVYIGYPLRSLSLCAKHLAARMACSKFAYVRKFETADPCLPNCWPVVRIDGKNFHKFSDKHNFQKPNDDRSLNLMNKSAETVMKLLSDVVVAYGQSDEYSFVFKKSTETYNRRASKLCSVVVSQFASAFVFHWKSFFPDLEMIYPPAFDSRLVLYPSDTNLRDYLSWRQADCHINNLYNTCFWALVHSGMTPHDVQLKLKGTVSGDKNEILFSQFNINYNNLPQLYRKGTVLVRKKISIADDEISKSNDASINDTNDANKAKRKKLSQPSCMEALNVDIIGTEFWQTHPYILKS